MLENSMTSLGEQNEYDGLYMHIYYGWTMVKLL